MDTPHDNLSARRTARNDVALAEALEETGAEDFLLAACASDQARVSGLMAAALEQGSHHNGNAIDYWQENVPVVREVARMQVSLTRLLRLKLQLRQQS